MSMIRPHHIIATYLGICGQSLLYYALFVLTPRITCKPTHWITNNVTENICDGDATAWVFGLLGLAATIAAIVIEFKAYYESAARERVR